jgi:hypothetical protein
LQTAGVSVDNWEAPILFPGMTAMRPGTYRAAAVYERN